MAEDQRLRELMREYQAAKADDLVQETCLQIHRARHTYDPSYPLTRRRY